MSRAEIRVKVPQTIKDKLSELAAAAWRDEAAQLCYMVDQWDTLVKPFNGLAAPAAVEPVAGKVAPAGKGTPKSKVPKRPGRKSERPPYVYNPASVEDGLPAYGKTTTFHAKMYFPKPPQREETIVPVHIVTRGGEPVGVRTHKDIMELLEAPYSDDTVQAGLDRCNHLNRAYHIGIAERFETLEELLERVREVGPTDDWIDEGELDQPVQPATPAEPTDDNIEDILDALDGDNA